jgi:quercetin dioxygenase-like cupin family protein
MGNRPTADEPLVRETIMDVRLPATMPVDRIEVRRIRMLPGQPAGLHVHNGPVVGNIVEGSVVYQIEGEPPSVLGPGEVFYEPEGARIARFDAGDAGATFLAYFPLRSGQEPAIDTPNS